MSVCTIENTLALVLNHQLLVVVGDKLISPINFNKVCH